MIDQSKELATQPRVSGTTPSGWKNSFELYTQMTAQQGSAKKPAPRNKKKANP